MLPIFKPPDSIRAKHLRHATHLFNTALIKANLPPTDRNRARQLGNFILNLSTTSCQLPILDMSLPTGTPKYLNGSIATPQPSTAATSRHSEASTPTPIRLLLTRDNIKTPQHPYQIRSVLKRPLPHESYIISVHQMRHHHTSRSNLYPGKKIKALRLFNNRIFKFNSGHSSTMEYCLIKNLAKENPVGKNSSEGKKSAVYS
ncbi:hypothetical protein LXL04_015113 [Taraxacum kok-saghyz]